MIKSKIRPRPPPVHDPPTSAPLELVKTFGNFSSCSFSRLSSVKDAAKHESGRVNYRIMPIWYKRKDREINGPILVCLPIL